MKTLQTILAEIAEWYDKAEHKPHCAVVRAHYEHFTHETLLQYAAIPVNVMFTDSDPYKTSAELFADCSRCMLRVFRTAIGTMPNGHPLRVTIHDATAGDWFGNTNLLNDAFRAVHDWYGHYLTQCGFGWYGELRAYLAHSRMYSPAAKRALFSETVAQLAWFYFGPHSSKPRNERPFADQKAVLVPLELHAALDSALTRATNR